MADDVVLELGWGRLIFGQTFADAEKLAEVLRGETHGRRDICIYAREPHVLVVEGARRVVHRPQPHLPAAVLRRRRIRDRRRPDSRVRTLQGEPEDADAINRVYVRCGMVPAPDRRHLGQPPATSDAVDYLVAVRDDDGSRRRHSHGRRPRAAVRRPGERLEPVDAGGRPDDRACRASVRRLTRALAAIYRDRGRAYMDLSVTHDNAAAIALYEKLGFQRVPVMAVKRKNAINEPLFTHPPETVDDLNPYARIIADEAMRRGIWVEVLDAEARRDAAVARRPQRRHPRIVVGVHLRGGDESLRRQAADPAHRRRCRHRGAEGPAGHLRPRTTTNSSPRSAMWWSNRREANRARASRSASTAPTNSTARWPGPASSIPRCSSNSAPPGDDLRLVVIDGKVVAAALRRPAEIVGTGHHTVRELIETQSRRRAAATGGESRIPMDDVTEATVAEAGLVVR